MFWRGPAALHPRPRKARQRCLFYFGRPLGFYTVSTDWPSEPQGSMAQSFVVLLGILTVVAHGAQAKSPSWTVVIPSKVYLNKQTTVLVRMVDSDLGPSRTVVEAEVRHPVTRQRCNRRKQPVESGKNVEFPLNIPGRCITGIEVAPSVRIVVHSKKPPVRREAVVEVSTKTVHLFLQTDKPLYTRGQKVLIRIFSVDLHLKPFGMNVKIHVLNPSGKVVERIRASTRPICTTHGIFDTSIKLSDTADYGKWTITAEYGYKHQSIVTSQFVVKRYVLPKFAVELQIPGYIMSEKQVLVGHVSAKYTYGKPVDGHVYLRFGVKTRKDIIIFGTIGDHVQYKTARNKPLELSDGQTDFEIDLSRLKQLGGWYTFPSIIGSNLYVEAEVTERSTGEKVKVVNASSIFTLSQYRIDVSHLDDHFQPGLPYRVFVHVQYANGGVAPWVIVNVLYNDDLLEAETDQYGYASLFLKTPTSPYPGSLEFKIYVGDEDHRMARPFTIHPDPGVTRDVIKLYPSAVMTEVGKKLQIYIFARLSSFHEESLTVPYLLMSKGQIQSHDTTTIRRQEDRYSGSVSVRITSAMVPSVGIYMYYLSHRREPLMATAEVNILNTCGNKVNVRGEISEGYAPGEAANILISAHNNSKVALMAVDNAALALGNTADLLRAQMDSLHMTATSLLKDKYWGIFYFGPGDQDRPSKATHENIKHRAKRDTTVKKKPLGELECCVKGERTAVRQLGKTCVQLAAEEARMVNPGCSQRFYSCCSKVARTYSRRDSGATSFVGRRLQTDQVGVSLRGSSPNILDSLMIREQDYTEPDYNLHRPEEDPKEPFHWTFEHVEEDPTLFEMRTFFPESWLFEAVPTGLDGKNSIPINIPHSVTTWSLMATEMSHTEGMCVTKATHLRVFYELFLEMGLPATAVLGEQLDVRVTVYSYLDENVPVILYVESHGGLCTGPEDTAPQKFRLPAHGAHTIVLPVVPMETGQVQIKVTAYSVHGGDSIMKNVTVTSPEPGSEGSGQVTDCIFDLLAEGTHVKSAWHNVPSILPKNEDELHGSTGEDVESTGDSEEGMFMFDSYREDYDFDGSTYEDAKYDRTTGEASYMDTFDHEDFYNFDKTDSGSSYLDEEYFGVVPTRKKINQLRGSSVVLDIKVCVRHRFRSASSNITGIPVAVLEVGLFTGFKPIIDDLQQINTTHVLRFEVTDIAVIFYLKNIYQASRICLQYRIKREYAASFLHPALVTLYPWRRKDYGCTKTIAPPHLTEPSPIALCSDGGCICTGKCGSCIKDEPITGIIARQLITKICTEFHFALLVKVTHHSVEKGFEKYDVIVDRVMLQGRTNATVDGSYILIKNSRCPCPHLSDKVRYLVAGPESTVILGHYPWQRSILLTNVTTVYKMSYSRAQNISKILHQHCPHMLPYR